jgi:hypothetical protein
MKFLMDFQEINYPILWGGHLACLNVGRVGTPIPQENLDVFYLEVPIGSVDFCSVRTKLRFAQFFLT